MKAIAIILCGLLAAETIGMCYLADEVKKHEHEVQVVETYFPVFVEYSPETDVSDTSEPNDEAEAVAEPVVYTFNVPLDDDLQKHIIKVSEENGIDPAIVIAMAKRESDYKANAVGDNGASVGLLQIQSKWHWGRMVELGCTNLFDPYQNVTVGVDYLADLLERYGDIYKALTAYNRGRYDGTVTEYAEEIMTMAIELEEARYIQNR